MRILLLADIHIGAIRDPKYVFSVMETIIDNELIFQHTDAVIILGDYFHKVFKANEENVSLAISVMSKLIRACQREHTKIRIIYGTESHEMSQYRLFNHHMTSKNVDIRLFSTVTEEELFPGVNVLYVPEEYIVSKKEHYASTLYSGKHYTYIFGHGVIKEGVPSIIAISENGKSKEKHVPHFDAEDLYKAADLVTFGHYHIHTDIGNNTWYVGSLFRWQFGEEEPKGYAVLNGTEFNFVENKDAWIYKTYDYGPADSIYNSEEALSKEIDRIKKENERVFDEEFCGKIRMRFTVPKDFDQTFRDKLSAMLANDNRIVVMFTNLGDALIEEIKEEIDNTEYDYLLDPNLTIYDKVSKYIDMVYGSVLALPDVTKYIKDALSHG